MTTSSTSNESKWQRMKKSGTKKDNECQRIITSDNELQWVTANNSEW